MQQKISTFYGLANYCCIFPELSSSPPSPSLPYKLECLNVIELPSAEDVINNLKNISSITTSAPYAVDVPIMSLTKFA